LDVAVPAVAEPLRLWTWPMMSSSSTSAPPPVPLARAALGTIGKHLRDRLVERQAHVVLEKVTWVWVTLSDIGMPSVKMVEARLRRAWGR
jgi:hypothetical protein